MTDTQKTALWELRAYAPRLTRQQYRTLKGQILAGDVDGYKKGLYKIARRGVRV